MNKSSRPGEDYFTKISNPVEKDKLFKDLANANAEIIAKLPQPLADIFKVKINLFNSKEVAGTLISGTSELPNGGELIIQLNLGGEKYYFMSKYVRKLESIYLNIDSDIFHLQRREDFRLKFPKSYVAKFDLKEYNGGRAMSLLNVIDFSAGGMRLEIPMTPSFLNVADIIKGQLQLSDRPSINIEAKVVHQTIDQEKKFSYAGIQFSNLTEPAKNKFAALVMDLYRETFARLSSAPKK